MNLDVEIRLEALTIGRALALFGIGLLFLALPQCKSDFEYFIVEVTSLEVPDSLSSSDTLQVRLYGTIGPNSAYSLDRIDARIEPLSIDLTVWGKQRQHRKGDAFLPAHEELDERYDAYPVSRGVFRIRVRQPDGSTLSDSTIAY